MLCMYMNRNRRNMHKMIYYPKGGMQMYMNTGYLNQSHQDFKDKRQPLVVGSCGCYRLSTYPKLPTYRPRGRLDYQIIYIASGKGYFHFDSPTFFISNSCISADLLPHTSTHSRTLIMGSIRHTDMYSSSSSQP